LKPYNLIILLSFITLFITNCSNAQTVEVIKFHQLDKIIKKDNGKIKIINFWATWCRPCVAEIPQFESLFEKYGTDELEMILVSFDFLEELESRVIPFVKKKNLHPKIVLLDETDYNLFIDKIDKKWSGAIPATLMIDFRKHKKAFFEKEFKKGELEEAYLTFTQ